MLKVDQFIYTSSSIRGKKGYQIVAKSDGITDEIISELDQYLYPIGIDPADFKESRSLILLKKGKIAYSKVRNIGIGYDGRDNTLYNHTLVTNQKDFEKYGNDTRIFDDFYVENSSVQGQLPVLEIDPSITEPNFMGITEFESLILEFFLALFNKQKIAILETDKIDLIPKLLSLVPPSVRLVSFSSLVVHPEKQSHYDIIQTEKQNKPSLKSNYTIIDPAKPIEISKNTNFEKSVSYLVRLISSQKHDELKKIHEHFEEIVSKDFKNKIILLTTFSQYESEIDEKLKQTYAEEIAGILKKFDAPVASEYLKKIKPHLRQYAILENKLQPVINPATSLIDAFFILPFKMMNDLYRAYIDQQKKIRDEEEDY